MPELLSFLSQAVTAHKELLALFALAAIVTMRDELPAPLNKVQFFVWCYAWIHDALKTFVSLRGPQPPKP